MMKIAKAPTPRRRKTVDRMGRRMARGVGSLMASSSERRMIAMMSPQMAAAMIS